jgi:hypothetical protein
MTVRSAMVIAIILSVTTAVWTQGTQSPASSQSGQNDRPTAATDAMKAEQPSNAGDPLLDVPPLPKGPVTLVGGTVTKIDQIRNRLVVQPFGGGDRLKLVFDERTHVFRDGTETTQMTIHKGDRVYVDTMLVGNRVFARNIRVQSQIGPADASGQVEAFDPNTGALALRDQLSAGPVSFRIDSSTAVTRDGRATTLADLKPGSLVSVKFAPGGRARGVVKEVSVIAVPGSSFTFVGRVTHLDLRTSSMAVENQSDGKTYDIDFNSQTMEGEDNLSVGSQVTVVATFTGSGYRAESITLNPETATQ